MKNSKAMKSVWLAVVGAAALIGPVATVQAQAPVIASFGRNGELVCTNLLAGSTASVVWASTLLGPWTNSSLGLDAVTADTNGAIRVSVPVLSWSGSMFCRVRGVPALPPFPPFAAPANMVWIAPGTFVMGSPTNEPTRYSDETQHTVTLSKGFCMRKYKMTQVEYRDLVGNNPSYFQTEDYNHDPIPPDPIRPVEMVSWTDATNYCAQLTARERSAGRLPAGYVYRLPTEAEWEFACRAGTNTPFHYGNELRSGMASFCGYYEYPPCDSSTLYCYNPMGIPLYSTTSVGSYSPNAWGLYDMHGDVWEWCQDWYGAYPGGSVTEPQGPTTGSNRVVRGGYWFTYAFNCRSARRYYYNPTSRSFSVGFRVVLAQVQ